MIDAAWSADELYDSVGSRGLEAMVAVTVRKEGLAETEARARAEEHFATCRLDRDTGAPIRSPEEWKAMADELKALAASITEGRKHRPCTPSGAPSRSEAGDSIGGSDKAPPPG